MSGDPRVLAPLQQAYLLAGDMNTRFSIRQSWRHETGVHGEREETDAAIRAWTPPPAEPSLEQRVAELEQRAHGHDEQYGELEERIRSAEMNIETFMPHLEQHPEPTAPDDPVCATCGHGESFHRSRNGTACLHSPSSHDPYCTCKEFIPAPQPAPDLDPVRVEAAAKKLRGPIVTPWDEIPAPSQAIYIHEAETVIRAYLNDGGA